MPVQNRKPASKGSTPEAIQGERVDERTLKAIEAKMRASPEHAIATAAVAISVAMAKVARGNTDARDMFRFRDEMTHGTPHVGIGVEEAEAWDLAGTFDHRLTEAEKRINRVLARLGVE